MIKIEKEEMTVSELIEELERMPQDLQVVMSQDEEGNGFSPFIDVSNDNNQCVILWPGRMDELDEVVDGYEYIEE